MRFFGNDLDKRASLRNFFGTWLDHFKGTKVTENQAAQANMADDVERWQTTLENVRNDLGKGETTDTDFWKRSKNKLPLIHQAEEGLAKYQALQDDYPRLVRMHKNVKAGTLVGGGLLLGSASVGSYWLEKENERLLQEAQELAWQERMDEIINQRLNEQALTNQQGGMDMEKQAYWRGFLDDFTGKALNTFQDEYVPIQKFDKEKISPAINRIYSNMPHPELDEKLPVYGFIGEAPVGAQLQFLPKDLMDGMIRNPKGFAVTYKIPEQDVRDFLTIYNNQLSLGRSTRDITREEFMAMKSQIDKVKQGMSNFYSGQVLPEYERLQPIVRGRYNEQQFIDDRNKARLAAGGTAAGAGAVGAGLYYGLREKEATLYEELMGKTAEEQSVNPALPIGGGLAAGSAAGYMTGNMVGNPKAQSATKQYLQLNIDGYKSLPEVMDLMDEVKKNEIAREGVRNSPEYKAVMVNHSNMNKSLLEALSRRDDLLEFDVFGNKAEADAMEPLIQELQSQVDNSTDQVNHFKKILGDFNNKERDLVGKVESFKNSEREQVYGKAFDLGANINKKYRLGFGLGGAAIGAGLGAGLYYGLRDRGDLAKEAAEEKEKSSNDYLAGAGIGSVVGKKLGGSYDFNQYLSPKGQKVPEEVKNLWQSGEKGKSILKGLGMMKGTLIGSGAGTISGVGLAHLMKDRNIERNPDGTPNESWTDNITGTTGGLVGGLAGAGYGALTGVSREQKIREKLENDLSDATTQYKSLFGIIDDEIDPDKLDEVLTERHNKMKEKEMIKSDADGAIYRHKLLYGENASPFRSRLVNAARVGAGGALTSAILGYGANRFLQMGKDTPVSEEIPKTAATWTRKEGQNPEGGLNQKGRDSYNRETGGNLKRPVSKEEASKSDKAASRRKSFCARMSGMKKRLTSAETARDPDSRINKALKKWDC